VTSVNQEQAIDAAKQVGVSIGEMIFVQSDGQIRSPHQHASSDFGAPHVDGWAVKNDYGTYKAAKIHSDDFERGVEPNFY